MQTKTRRTTPRYGYDIKYMDYLPMIKDRAKAWKIRTGWEQEDLISEGNLVFVLCLSAFDRSKSSFSTYLYRSLEMRFCNIVNFNRCKKSGNQYRNRMIELDNRSIDSLICCPETENIFLQLIEGLPSDAKEIIQAIFEIPDEIIGVLKVTRINKNVLARYFISFRGWTQTRVWNAFLKIQKVLN